MKKARPSSLLQYQYPAVVMRFPWLLRMVYMANYFTQLRKWYIVSSWKRMIAELGPHKKVIDFGAGEAQYLVPYCKANPQITFHAIDNRSSNVAFCNALAFDNLKGTLMDIELETSSFKGDLGICIGVMQYLAQDEQALKNIANSLNKGAKLLLYVPINGVFLTRVYRYVFEKYAQYESINERKRVYTEAEIMEKLSKAGFMLINKTYTYGFWGKLSHELLNTWSTLIFSGPLFAKLFALVFLLFSLPLILLFMVMDYLQTKSNGNGLLIEVRKA